MPTELRLHPDRLLPPEGKALSIARELYDEIAGAPIVSPHGHTDPKWFAADEPFCDPASLLVMPDHYLTRMLYSQGVTLDSLGISSVDGNRPGAEPRAAWQTFADHYHLFRGTPSGMWLDHVLAEVFELPHRLDAGTANDTYDRISECLADAAFRPRALLDRFGIDVLATTDSPLSSLEHHERLGATNYAGRVIPTFRPDDVVDPHHDGYADNVAQLGSLTGRDTSVWTDYLAALFDRRQLAITHGATASDHGHPSAFTSSINDDVAQRLLTSALLGALDAEGAEMLRGRVLVEMARMSTEDGLVMQLHPGPRRNHNRQVHKEFGRDMGADIPGPVNYVDGLQALLDEFGNDSRFRMVLFTLDESTFTRELAPLAGHYPTIFLGPPWWFLDSFEAMLRYRRGVTETAGFANMTGFIDDTRALMSIPARHDVARRVDSRYLAELVADHRLTLDDAHEIAADMVGNRTQQIFNLNNR